MNRATTQFFCPLFLLLSMASLPTATVTAAGKPTTQEPAWEKALTTSLNENEIKWLNTPNEKYIALYTDEFTGRPQGGVILLHGMGYHPDWPEVISPLRRRLPEYGWSTLSIQLPAFESGARIDDYAATQQSAERRIKATIDHFKEIGIGNIVLVGHGLGAVMAAAYLNSNPEHGTAAFVGISMPSHSDIDSWMEPSNAIRTLKIPVLDIHGSRDLTSVIQSAQQRARVARKATQVTPRNRRLTGVQRTENTRTFNRLIGFAAYRRIQVTGANHFFTGYQDELSKRVAGWLRHNAGGVSIAQ